MKLENGEVPDGDFMQTFLPYADFARGAQALDRTRLGKQRVETLQIIKALLTGSGWVNHPATRMWENHIGALYEYQVVICNEWKFTRGYEDTCAKKTFLLVDEHMPEIWEMDKIAADFYPWWLGMHRFHRSHRSNLVRKNRDHYGPLFGEVPDDLPYYWPLEETGLVYR